MRQRQDWVVPYFNGQYRFDKPPLTYWAQVASYVVFGENDLAARFPSAIAAALTAVLIFAWGCRISGETAGWRTAIIFTLCLQTFLHGKAAVADMWLVLFMTASARAGFELLGPRLSQPVQLNRHDRKTMQLWWWTFYISLALAFLSKGPIGLIPLIPVIAFAWKFKGSGIARQFRFLGGLVLTAAIVSAWAVPALIATHGEFFRIGIGRHVVGRSLGAMEGHGARSIGIYFLLLPFYFVVIFLSFFPWSIKLPRLIGRMRAGMDLTDVYLVWGVSAVFAIFTLVATKLPHYTLPALPLISLLLGRHWAAETADPARVRRGFKLMAILTATAWIIIALVLPPAVARNFPAYALFQQSRADLQPNTELAAVEFNEPSLVWYFRSQLKGFMKPLRRGKVMEFMSQPGSRMVILPTEQIDAAVTAIGPEWKRFDTVGFSIPKGKKVNLTMLLKPD
jgi:4-amino-4-deoxy-L-arabinose transferase-like glycosyltransferase